eukprot:Anaeramoba_ignava/a232635_12.p1 GENE.a232635_12~~a232635_12.p1  ORF type:complete len:185 (+),score=41.30 a232635_12:35-589(+)
MEAISELLSKLLKVEREDLPKKLRTYIRIGIAISVTVFIWNTLRVIMDCDGPVVVVLSESMEPGFYRGDILFVRNNKDPLKAGEIIVFKVKHQEIPIVHRVISTNIDSSGQEYILTKGDNNLVDDRSLYSVIKPQLWLRREEIEGTVYGYIPFVGMFTIWVNESPLLKYITLAFIFILSYYTKD